MTNVMANPSTTKRENGLVLKIGRNANKLLRSELLLRGESKLVKEHFSLGIVNSSKQVHGMAIGALASDIDVLRGLNISAMADGRDVRGAAIGLMNDVQKANGVNICLLGGYASTVNGLNAGSIIIMSKNVNGVSIGGMSSAQEIFGATVGCINVVKKKLRGFAFGLINFSKSFQGVKVGLVNICNQPSKGADIGILNIRTDAPWYAKISFGLAYRFSKKSAKCKAAPDHEGDTQETSDFA